jgi:omega-6 fatty acid desaturase (delta-12 desaturase)
MCVILLFGEMHSTYWSNSVWDLTVVLAFYKATTYVDPLINTLELPHPLLYTAAHVSLWALYGFWAGLFSTGLWVIAHEYITFLFSPTAAG